MDASETLAAEQPRPSRVEVARRSRRPLVIGISLVAILLLASIASGGWYLWQRAENRPPEHLVVVGESMLEDGTTVAGLVAVVEPGASSVKAIDSGMETAIPGTSYSRLRDALSMGGPQEIVALVAPKDAEKTGWIVLDEQAWAQLIDRVGGIQVSIPEETTVFTGEKLFRFSVGTKFLTGDEAVALVMGADEFVTDGSATKVRVAVSEAVARALAENPQVAREVLTGRATDLSHDPELVLAFLSQGR